MWMMTQHAFSSTVFKQVDDGWYLMRFRDQESADAVCRLAELDPERVYTDMPSDYPLRLKISEDELVRYFLAEVKKVDYNNFKTRAKKVRGQKYASALSRVWTAMLGLTSDKLRQQNYAAWDEYDRKHKLGKYRPKKGKGSRTVVYTSGTHPAAEDTVLSDYDRWADSDWWKENFPPRGDAAEMLDADSDFTDLEDEDDLVETIDRLLKVDETKSVHDMTEDEWRAFMEETPGGI